MRFLRNVSGIQISSGHRAVSKGKRRISYQRKRTQPWHYKLLFSKKSSITLIYMLPLVFLGYVVTSNIYNEIDFRLKHRELLVAQENASSEAEAFFVEYVRNCYSRPGQKVDNCIADYVTENPQGLGFKTQDEFLKDYAFALLSYRYDLAKRIYKQ